MDIYGTIFEEGSAVVLKGDRIKLKFPKGTVPTPLFNIPKWQQIRSLVREKYLVDIEKAELVPSLPTFVAFILKMKTMPTAIATEIYDVTREITYTH